MSQCRGQDFFLLQVGHQPKVGRRAAIPGRRERRCLFGGLQHAAAGAGVVGPRKTERGPA